MNNVSRPHLAILAAVISITTLHAWVTRDGGGTETEESKSTQAQVESAQPAIAADETLFTASFDGNTGAGNP